MKLIVFTIYCKFSVITFEPSKATQSCRDSASPKSALGTSGSTVYGGIPWHVAGVWVGHYHQRLTGKFVCSASLPALPLWQVTNNTLEVFSALKNVFLKPLWPPDTRSHLPPLSGVIKTPAIQL